MSVALDHGVPQPLPLDGLGQLLPRLAARWGDRPALVTGDRTLTFNELDRLAARVAHALLAKGVRAGDRVALMSQNRWEWIVAYHGALRAGAVVNPLNVMLTGEELAYILTDSGASILFASQECLQTAGSALTGVGTLEHRVNFDGQLTGTDRFTDMIDKAGDQPFAPVSVSPESLACIAYTSGTTGYPKGAMQSHLSLVLNCAYTASMHVRTAEDVVLSALPSAHVYGNVVINSTLMAGGRVVLMSRFDVDETIRRIEDHRVTLFEGVPAMYATLLASPSLKTADLSSLTRCTVGGQTIAESVIESWEQHSGAPLIELWGMTELSGLGSTHALYAPPVRGSIGVVLPGNELRVVDAEDPSVECDPGVPGELLARGPLVTMGYFNNPKATAEAITPDGWLHTGDVATRDSAGRFFVVDRLKDLILTGGYNVYPAEIERVLMGHPGVALVAVGREPHDVKGEVAHAYVIPTAERPTTDELLAYCRERLAAYKVPRAIHFVTELPTTSSGKLMRRMLRSS